MLTVEWNPDNQFQLNKTDAEVLLQVGGGDLMWQKERLLGIAVAALPDHVEYVAWLDCDVLFNNVHWQEEARDLLDDRSVLQLFSEIAFPDETASLRLTRSEGSSLDGIDSLKMRKRESFLGVFGRLKEDIVGFDLDHRFEPDRKNQYDIMRRPAYGFAWASRADFIRRIGIYDRGVMGAGDMMFCYGISGLSRQLIDNHKTVGWGFYGDCDSYRHWASKAAEACAGGLGCASGRILHLFHGTLQERQYKSRIDGLVPFALDLDRDIVAEQGRPWSWSRSRDRLNQYFLEYLRNRNEDGRVAGRPGEGAKP
ncbi:MAG: hypothetical protein WCF16_08710 [Alphaproteobacteria bacterium]